MADKKPFVVACIPAYNEEGTIAKVVVQTMKYVDKVVVCDDGSSDMTGEIAEQLGAEVLRHERNMGWGRLYLDDSHMIVHFEVDVDFAVDTALNHGFSQVYFVWWNQPIGWYGITVPEGFVRLRDFGRISVYEFAG